MIKTITLFLFFLFSNSIYSQINVGIFGGLNSSKLSGDVASSSEYKSLLGANFGVNVDAKLSKSIYLSLQPSYSQEGSKVAYKINGNDKAIDSLKIRLNYFSIPLLLKMSSTNERFYAIAGIESGFLFSSYIESGDLKEDILQDLVSYNIVMHFGVGIRIPVGFPRLFTELRYSQGIINLTDVLLYDNTIPRVKTSGLKILVGIEIPLKKATK